MHLEKKIKILEIFFLKDIYIYILLKNINSIESYDANESRGQTLGEHR